MSYYAKMPCGCKVLVCDKHEDEPAPEQGEQCPLHKNAKELLSAASQLEEFLSHEALHFSGTRTALWLLQGVMQKCKKESP